MPAGGRGLLGHFDDHLLLSFSCYFSENAKSADILLSQNTGAWGTDDLVWGTVPFLKGKQKRPSCFSQTGRTAGRWIWVVKVSGAGALFQLMVKQKGRQSVGCG